MSDSLSYKLGQAAFQRGDYEQAALQFAYAIAADRGQAAPQVDLGNTLAALGRLDEALEWFDRALVIDPQLADTYVSRGLAFLKARRFDEAAEDFGNAIAIHPDRAAYFNALGAALFGGSRFEEAAEAFARAVASDGQVAEFQTNLASAQSHAGNLPQARQAYLTALGLEPERADIRLQLAVDTLQGAPDTAAEAGEMVEAFEAELAALDAWARASPQRLAALGAAATQAAPFFLGYRLGDHTALMARYGALISEAVTARVGPAPAAPARLPGARAKLLFVSSHVRRHSVQDVITHGWLQRLDRSRFEIAVAHVSADHDEVTVAAAGLADQFVQGVFSTDVWAEKIRGWRPDAILHPEVGMHPATAALAALRLAPLQAAGWGHPLTTGLPTIDLYLSAAALEGPGADAHYSERLIRLPGIGVFPASRTEIRPDLSLSARLWPEGPPRHPVFVVPHSDFKLDPAYDDIYADIAEAFGAACQFVFFRDPALGWRFDKLMQRLAGVFRARGLDPATHLVTSPWLTASEFQGLLSMDVIYLDPLAFSGFTTAWTALHAGVPVVTLEGAWLRQRLAAGLMRDLGLTETIAHDLESYVAIACGLARRPARRAALRKKALELIAKYQPSAGIMPALEQALTA